MKILVLMFEGPISNKKNKEISPPAHWDALGKKDFFEFLDQYEHINSYLKFLPLIIKK